MNKKFGFTLAEVLVTLGVIGVVAAITIPNLIKNYKRHETENRLKVAYSILSQAINKAKAEYGDVSGWDDTLSHNAIAERYITPYLEVTKTKNGNLSMHTLFNNHADTYLHTWYADSYASKIFYLKNGMRFVVANRLKAWNFAYQLYITVDLNGDKGPNTLGYDGFVFVVNKKNNQLLPMGANGTYWGGSGNFSDSDIKAECSSSNNYRNYGGETCAELIRRNNWKIPDDYIW